MDSERKNYYDVLEINSNSTLQEIHNAYRRSKNAYSGDSVALYSLMSQDECEKILSHIEDAYSILGVPEKRREYDIVKGFNQSNTVEGFTDEIQNTLSYKPKNSLNDLISETQNSTPFQDEDFVQAQEAQKEEFKYNQAHSAKSEVEFSKIQAFKKFGLNYDVNIEFEQTIENCTEYTGEFLKEIREYKGVTIERMADMTKISKTYIRNIETNDFGKLPAEVYTRGFVYQFAKSLKLNPELVATSYIHYMKQSKTDAI